MKAKERKIYITLSDEIAFTLCSFCRYSESIGCGDGNECKHPLQKHYGFPFWEGETEPGDDCWAFRPLKRYSIGDFAEIVGTYIEQKWEIVAWEKRTDGMIEMEGSKNFY